MTDLSTSKVYAAKIIPHARVSKPHQREKVSAQLRSLSAVMFNLYVFIYVHLRHVLSLLSLD